MAEMSTPIGVTSGTLGAQRSDIVGFNGCSRPYVQLSMPHFSPPVALEEMVECNSTQTHADISAALSKGDEFVESQLGTENILCPLFLSGVVLPKRASEQADTEEETKVEDIASQQVF